jgi:hypothetical protein
MYNKNGVGDLYTYNTEACLDSELYYNDAHMHSYIIHAPDCVLGIGALRVNPRHRHRLTLGAPRTNNKMVKVIYICTINKEALNLSHVLNILNLFANAS